VIGGPFIAKRKQCGPSAPRRRSLSGCTVRAAIRVRSHAQNMNMAAVGLDHEVLPPQHRDFVVRHEQFRVLRRP